MQFTINTIGVGQETRFYSLVSFLGQLEYPRSVIHSYVFEDLPELKSKIKSFYGGDYNVVRYSIFN